MTFVLTWNGRRRLVAVQLFCRSCAQAGLFIRVPLPPPTAVRPPHCSGNEECCVYLNAAVEQPSVRSVPFKTERSIPAAAAAASPLVRASPKESCRLEGDSCGLVKIYLSSRGTCCLHILQYAQGKFPRQVDRLRCCVVLHLKRYCFHIHCRQSLQRHTRESNQYLIVLGFS